MYILYYHVLYLYNLRLELIIVTYVVRVIVTALNQSTNPPRDWQGFCTCLRRTAALALQPPLLPYPLLFLHPAEGLDDGVTVSDCLAFLTG